MDVAPQILLSEDQAVAQAIREAFQKAGLEVILGVETLKRIDLHEGLRRLTYAKDGAEHTIDAEMVLLSVGWPGNLSALNLTAAGVETIKDYIQVDDTLQTSASHIYAAGDINGRMMLVQSAEHQGRIAAENALLAPKTQDQRQLVPHGGFTDPEYASIGLTEKQAREKYDIAVATVPLAATDRAVIDDHLTGFCKLIVDRATHQIIGAHMVGEQAMEVVHVVAAGMAGHMSIQGFATLEIAYPTFTSVIGLAARQIARELGLMPILHTWQMGKKPISEWEHRAHKMD
jgi:pyruvate/2-oxoglutarate dehydrogenase complex dihydrolipoamide dehydrogenase (E3) component